MSKNNQIWVSPLPNGDWKIKQPGNQKASRIAEKKIDAREIAIQIAKNQNLEMVIQRKDGVIQEKNTYPKSRDNFPPKG